MPDITLSAIHIYPVKSCRAVALDSATVAATGLAHDRLYQVVDEAGTPITQRQHPALATVQPSLIDGGLRLESEGQSALELAHPATNTTEVGNLLGITVPAADLGEEAAAWFGAVLDVPCRLVAMTDATELVVDALGVQTSFADAAPTLVANTASLEWLANRGSEPFGMERFRPNLTVSGADAWDEETWRTFTIGQASLGLGIAWPRCAIPQIDQVSGDRHKEPAKILREHRWVEKGSLDDPFLAAILEGNAVFGIACSIGAPGAVVSVGDPVEIGERCEPVLAPPA